MTITLADLGQTIGAHVASSVPVSGLSVDSRTVSSDVGFVAVPGQSSDGRCFLKQALAAGAPIVIYEAHGIEAVLPAASLEALRQAYPEVVFLPVTALITRMGALAQAVYPVPEGVLKVAAVTGTNGKTTTSGWVAGACQRHHAPAGWSGTLGIGLYDQLQSSNNTTPDIFTLWQWLHQIHRQRGLYAAMEASSHALAQQRFFGLPIHTAVWTHLTQDHLDYHGTMAGYAAEKRKLLRWPDLKYCVLNLGDATAREAYEQGDYSGQALTYQVCPPGLQPEETFTPHPEAAYVIPKVTCSADGLSMTLRTPEGEKPWQLPCWGYFNAENALAALLTLISFGWTIQEACEALVQVPLPTGRMEPLKRTGLATVIIDYAHTPDALKQVLLAARPHCQGRLWVVFGCGGDRDTTKRPLMGAAAQALADAVVLTDDNPRSEASHSIIEDIQSGMTLEGGADQCWVEPDRAKAIALALRSATGEDVIVVAGKGHETYQEIAGERFAFNDREVVGALFDELVVD